MALATTNLNDEVTIRNPKALGGRPNTPPGFNGHMWGRCVNAAHSKFLRKRSPQYSRVADNLPPGRRNRFLEKEAMNVLREWMGKARGHIPLRNDSDLPKIAALNQTGGE
jgi:hypothetical protein